MSKPRIVFTRHAKTMMTERGIKEEWIRRTVSEPEAHEVDRNRMCAGHFVAFLRTATEFYVSSTRRLAIQSVS